MVKALQEYLGQIHDCDVWLEKLSLYRNEPGLSEERVSALAGLIADRAAHRDRMYTEAVAHWQGMAGSRFARRLMRLVRSAPVGIESKDGEETDLRKTGGQEPKAAEETSAPVAEVVKKTVARRATAKPAVAKELPLQESAKNGLGQCITRATEAMTSAAARVGAGNGSAKLAKQFGKVEAVLGALGAKAPEMQQDDSTKIEKWLAKLTDVLTSVPEDKKLSDKDADRLRDRIRRLRKKIADKTE